MSSAVFKRISTRTGGKAYFAKTWQKQVEAFESIREDLGNSYTITYYPQPNPMKAFARSTSRSFRMSARSTACAPGPVIAREADLACVGRFAAWIGADARCIGPVCNVFCLAGQIVISFQFVGCSGLHWA